MAKETFEVSGPGYLEHAGIKLGERLWGDTLICNRVEVRQTRAEFEVQWTEFERSVLYDESERRWNATKCQVWEVFSNKAAAIERAKFIERDYCQAAEEDLLDRQEIALERDRADREAPSAKFLTLFDLSRAAQEWELTEDTRQQTPEGTVDEHETSRLETFAKGLAQDALDRAAKADRGHLAKQSETSHERARAERTEEKECGSELEP
jgi:hypothetical protein